MRRASTGIAWAPPPPLFLGRFLRGNAERIRVARAQAEGGEEGVAGQRSRGHRRAKRVINKRMQRWDLTAHACVLVARLLP